MTRGNFRALLPLNVLFEVSDDATYVIPLLDELVLNFAAVVDVSKQNTRCRLPLRIPVLIGLELDSLVDLVVSYKATYLPRAQLWLIPDEV